MSMLLVLIVCNVAWAVFEIQVVDDPGAYFGDLKAEHAVAVNATGTV